jgi:hypothetical protein
MAVNGGSTNQIRENLHSEISNFQSVKPLRGAQPSLFLAGKKSSKFLSFTLQKIYDFLLYIVVFFSLISVSMYITLTI